jgi:hypothetical protein
MDNLKEMTIQLQKQRQASLEREVRSGVTKPEYIYDALQREMQEAIEKSSPRTHFSYSIASYNGLDKRFGKDDTEKAALEMGREYMAEHFPCAQTISINYDRNMYGSENVMFVNIHFTLPWLSGQTNSQTQPE